MLQRSCAVAKRAASSSPSGPAFLCNDGGGVDGDSCDGGDDSSGYGDGGGDYIGDGRGGDDGGDESNDGWRLVAGMIGGGETFVITGPGKIDWYR